MKIATADRVDRAGLLEFVRPRHHGLLATTRTDGRPQLSPVSCGVDAEGRIVVSTYPQRAKSHNARRDPRASICVLSDPFDGPYVQVDGRAEVLDLPDALEPLIEYYRCIAGEHPDWTEYRAAMRRQGKCLIRITIDAWGPIATGGFPPHLARVTDEPDIVTALRTAGCVFAEEEAALLTAAANSPAELADLIRRRTAGLPLEQVVGWAGFGGLRIAVDPGVFVPRRRTEFLVEHAATLAPPAATIVDLCCGSGALGAALAHTLRTAAGPHTAAGPPKALYAVDLDAAAVRTARRNLEPFGGHVLAGDLYDPLPHHLRGRVDILLANVPYVPTAAVDLLPAEARLHEPRHALDGGPDGLDLLRRVAAAAPQWLAPGGHLLTETSTEQVPTALAILAGAGLRPAVVHDPDRDATVVTGHP